MKKLKNIPPGADGLWMVMRHLKSFTVSDILPYVTAPRGSVLDYAGTLVRGGYLSVRIGERRGEKHFTLQRDTGIHRPAIARSGAARPPDGRQRMWMALKALGDFSAYDLSLVAKVPKKQAKRYLFALRDAGYLRLAAKSVKGRRCEVYRIVPSRDTGPKAPRLTREGHVYDQNLHRVVWPAPAHEDAPLKEQSRKAGAHEDAPLKEQSRKAGRGRAA